MSSDLEHKHQLRYITDYSAACESCQDAENDRISLVITPFFREKGCIIPNTIHFFTNIQAVANRPNQSGWRTQHSSTTRFCGNHIYRTSIVLRIGRCHIFLRIVACNYCRCGRRGSHHCLAPFIVVVMKWEL